MNNKLSKNFVFIGFVYLILFFNAYFMGDSYIAIISAFCGITYTILAGKGNPICYIIGLTGSGFYIYLAYINHFWGNLCLYALYFVPMQIIGFFSWNKHLKTEKYEILKRSLSKNELIIPIVLTVFLSLCMIFILYYLQDKNPIIDGLTTVFSILGMYLTVKRAIQQWIIWTGVNLLSLIMWLIVLINGIKVYSTVFMWLVYLILSIYFYFEWKKEIHN